MKNSGALNSETIKKWLKRLVALAMLVLVTGAFFGLPTAFACKVQPAPTLAFAAVLLATPLVGRLFCETMCPLGILQSVVNKIFRGRKSVRRVCTRLPESPRRRAVRLAVLAAFVTLAFAGFSGLAWTITPYSIYGKALALVAPGLALFVAILVSAAFGKGRIWCNWICPIGTIFSYLSIRSVCAHKVGPSCGNCMACFPNALAKAKTSATERGTSAAPTPATERGTSAATTPATERGTSAATATGGGAGITRRDALKGIALVAAVEVAEKTTDGGLAPVELAAVPPRPASIMPPGAVPRAKFNKVCVGCQLCVANCPEKCLKPSLALATFGQPEMDYREGHCLLSCTRCGEVCPAGAIVRLTPDEKRNTHIGHAIWKKDLCLRNTRGVPCTACSRKCPVEAIHIVEGFPTIDKKACIGCGACEHVCPARPSPAIFVKGFDTQRTVRPFSEADLIGEMKSLIEKGGYASVVAVDGVITAKESGRDLGPLFAHLDGGRLKGALVVDKAIGRAAAALLVAGKARRIHALLMGEDARAFLAAHGIEATADKFVPKILARNLVDDCPMEATVRGLDDPEKMVAALREKIRQFKAAAAKD